MSQPNCEKSRDTLLHSSDGTAIHLFRRCLRFHDNPALSEAISVSSTVKCVYIIDPVTASGSSKVESNKWRFLLESLHDLDDTLRKYNSRLYVIQGQPTFILPKLFEHWDVTVLSIEEDPSPYGVQRDETICSLAYDHGVDVIQQSSHTLHSIPKYVTLCSGRIPATIKQFTQLFLKAGKPDYYIGTVNFDRLKNSCDSSEYDHKYGVPSFDDLGLPTPADSFGGHVWRGGESEALKRLTYHLERRAWVARFEGNSGMTSSSLRSSPAAVGPYINFGCLSPRLLYWKMEELYKEFFDTCESPPLNIHGQLIIREYYYLTANVNKCFDQVAGNKLCVQVPWKKTDLEVMKRLISAATGFPWIDAIVKQLVSEGWIHGLAKAALIGFITHGQLFFSWEEAAKLLDTYCLEGDVCTNCGIAMFYSGSSYAMQLPSGAGNPILNGKTLDPTADHIRHYLPILRSFPERYIYEPWTAPLELQQQAGCIIGQDYSAPTLDHYQSFHTNMLILQQSLKACRERRAARKRHRHPAVLLSCAVSDDTLTFNGASKYARHLKVVNSPRSKD